MITLNENNPEKEEDNVDNLKDIKLLPIAHKEIKHLKIDYNARTYSSCIYQMAVLCKRLNALANKLIIDDNIDLLKKTEKLMELLENMNLDDNKYQFSDPNYKKIDIETYNALAFMADFSLQESEIDNLDEKIKRMILRFKKQAEELRKKRSEDQET